MMISYGVMMQDHLGICCSRCVIPYTTLRTFYMEELRKWVKDSLRRTAYGLLYSVLAAIAVSAIAIMLLELAGMQGPTGASLLL